ncbi:HNH/ENDO VII family nuclease [Bacillus marasmi]|uniref:HNH/ENDO VII family nuclease n=1 Tax=Bacillus marasmi TaxID=1926279 RepID=UPI001FEBFC09|nr:HNH/ENDO VII family nuclease [Bacillus marasmi]
MMEIDLVKTLDAVGDGVKNGGEVAHKSMENFHKNYMSKIAPKDGKFGDSTKFVAEMVPGVSEYNAVREGDWKAFAIAGGIDVAMIGVTVATGGLATGAAVGVKVGTEVGKTAVKTVMREGTEAVAKKAIKEGNEAVLEKTAHEGVEAIAKKTFKEGTKEVAEKTETVTLESKEVVLKEGSRFKPLVEALKDASPEEVKIYKEANLKEETVKGREALIRTDIDNVAKDKFERTNLERMEQGLAPLVDDHPIELHHIGQEMDSPLAELKWKEHRGEDNYLVLHDSSKESEINRPLFNLEKEAHWKARAEQIKKLEVYDEFKNNI